MGSVQSEFRKARKDRWLSRTIAKALRTLVGLHATLLFLALPAFIGCSLLNEEWDVTDNPNFQPTTNRTAWVMRGDRFVVTEPLFVYTGSRMPTNVNDKLTPVLLPPGADRFDLFGPTPERPIVPDTIVAFDREPRNWPNVIGVLPKGTRLEARRLIRCVNRFVALQSSYLYLNVLESAESKSSVRLNADLYWPAEIDPRIPRIGIERLTEPETSTQQSGE